MYRITAYYIVNGSKSERKVADIIVKDVDAQRKQMEASLPAGHKIFFEYRDEKAKNDLYLYFN